MSITEAYLLVERPSIAHKGYIEENQSAQRWADNYPRFREVLRFLNPEQYRGISRNPLSAFSVTDIDTLRKSDLAKVDGNTAARLRMLEFPDRFPEYFDIDHILLRSLEQAVEIYSLLEPIQKDKYEIIHASLNAASIESNTLGFDIGYWGGDFSIICDCVIRPEWHGPSWEDLPAVAEQVKKLNSNLLFENFAEAESYKKFYKSHDWAETECGDEFAIIRINECALPTY